MKLFFRNSLYISTLLTDKGTKRQIDNKWVLTKKIGFRMRKHEMKRIRFNSSFDSEKGDQDITILP